MFSPKRLCDTAFVPASPTSLYSPSTKQICILSRVTFSNESSTIVKVTAWLVDSGGTPDGEASFRMVKSIEAGGSWILSEFEGHVLNAGDSIQVLASVANAVKARVSGNVL